MVEDKVLVVQQLQELLVDLVVAVQLMQEAQVQEDLEIVHQHLHHKAIRAELLNQEEHLVEAAVVAVVQAVAVLLERVLEVLVEQVVLVFNFQQHLETQRHHQVQLEVDWVILVPAVVIGLEVVEEEDSGQIVFLELEVVQEDLMQVRETVQNIAQQQLEHRL
jgi:hypothetical protein